MEYRVVIARSIEELELKVNEMIDDDWEPQGSMSISNDGEMFYQPMLMIDEFDDDDLDYEDDD